MSALPLRSKWEEVREAAKELKNKIEGAFPETDVEYVDWVTLNGNWAYWQTRGFPPISIGVDACLLIRGDMETTEEAALLADGEVARLLEEANMVIRVQRDDHVWCKKSAMLEAQALAPGQELTSPVLHPLGHNKGITFWCSATEPHDHDFGRLQGKYREVS